MSLSITGTFHKSEYENNLETAVNAQLSNLSANQTTLSGNLTALNDFSTVTAAASASFTLSLATYRNFSVTNSTTAGKTFLISGAPTASDTMLNVNVKMVFSATATITYTGTITWSQNTAPNPTAVGTFILNLKSFDAGTTWLASYTGLY